MAKAFDPRVYLVTGVSPITSCPCSGSGPLLQINRYKFGSKGGCCPKIHVWGSLYIQNPFCPSGQSRRSQDESRQISLGFESHGTLFLPPVWLAARGLVGDLIPNNVGSYYFSLFFSHPYLCIFWDVIWAISHTFITQFFWVWSPNV